MKYVIMKYVIMKYVIMKCVIFTFFEQYLKYPYV